MDLGNFSISLTVKDLKASKAFYEKLGFVPFHGDEAQGWLIMKGPNVNIGLFQGMFEKNILTFNPGWDKNGKNIEDFTDIRAIQEKLKVDGIALTSEVNTDEGPGSFTLVDPDGNPILIDQHR